MEGTADSLYQVVQKTTSEKTHCARCIANDCGIFLFAYKFAILHKEFIIISWYAE